MTAPAGTRADDDQVGCNLARLLDHRGADRASAHRVAAHRHLVLLGERPRLGQGLGGEALLGLERRVERLLERHLDHVHGDHRGAALLGDPHRGGHHLLADVAHLHRHQDGREAGFGRLLLAACGNLLEQAGAALVADETEDRQPQKQPDRATVTGSRMGEHRQHEDEDRERGAEQGGQRQLAAEDAQREGNAVRTEHLRRAVTEPDHRQLNGAEGDQNAE